MFSRRGFLGAVAAIVAAPRALFAREPKLYRPSRQGDTTTHTDGSLSGTYRYRVTFYDATKRIETPIRSVSTVAGHRPPSPG